MRASCGLLHPREDRRLQKSGRFTIAFMSRLSKLSVGALPMFLAALATPALAQRPVEVAPNAPQDQPVSAAMRCQLRLITEATAPYVAQARATYPAARERFLQGLPPRHTMFVTTRLVDSAGRVEQVFVAVDSIRGSTIAGRIWSPIQVVHGYTLRQPYSFDEGALVDWMVARPDGTEEGNVVGKFLDTYRPPTTCTDPAGTR